MPATSALLEVSELRTSFDGERGEVRAVDGVSFRLERGRTLGIVGESGCGKSVTALSIMGLVPQPPGRIAGGEVLFDGVDLLKVAPARLRDLRGDQLAMIFQEPMTSLNPAFPVGEQIAETLLRHREINHREARAQSIEMLRRVRIPSPERRVDDYPHQLSGGMRQRVLIAMALACKPSLVIADEPTTALDVTIQAQVLDLLREMKAAFHLSLLLITHDLGVVAETADRVAVMYAGRIVETGPARAIFRDPQHPYTRGLLASIPGGTPGRRLRAIDGSVPLLDALPPGCAFNPRCPDRFDPCTSQPPPEYAVGPDHGVRCYLRDEFARKNAAR